MPAAKKSDAWRARALAAVIDYARKHASFTVQDVRYANPEIIAAGTQRSWGAVIREAERQGVVRNNGFRRVKSSNGSAKVLWRSLIVKAA